MHIQNTFLRLKATTSGAFSHPAQIIGFAIVAVIAPFLLLTTGGKEPNQLPWAFWAIVPIAALGIISVGFLRFAHESHEADSISISPDRKSKV
jgi:hypothetical protein